MKRIELILKNDTADGPLKYLIGSETTIGYKIQREFINKDLPDVFYEKLHQPGVYVLVGKRVKEKNESIYIGQSDNVAKRLYEHKGGLNGEKQQGKIFWNECMAFVTTDSQMQKGHAEYLELEFYKKAYEANRFILENENMPSVKPISEGDKIFCDDFIEDCDLLSTLMGLPIFYPKEKEILNDFVSKSNELRIDNSNRKGIDDPKYVNAKGYKCEDENSNSSFVVLENSIITKEVTKKASSTLKKLRKDLIKRGFIQEDKGKLIFKREYSFLSAGIVASVVLGRNASSNEWKE